MKFLQKNKGALILNLPIDRATCIGKKVVISKEAKKIRILEMKKWKGRIYDYDPIYDRFMVCWIDGTSTHHFKEHPDMVALDEATRN